MKHAALTSIALVSLAAAPAATSAPLSGDKISDADAKITATLDALDEMAKLGIPLEPTIQGMDELISQMQGPASMRARMSAYLDDLRDRTRRTFVNQTDIAVFRRDFAHSRVIAFLGDLNRRAKHGDWTVERYADALESWVARGRAFTDAPDPAEYRARFRAAARQAYQDARSVNRFAQSLEAQLREDRLMESAATLAWRKADRTASATDVARVVRHTSRRIARRRHITL